MIVPAAAAPSPLWALGWLVFGLALASAVLLICRAITKDHEVTKDDE
jgi:hypothetical protein